MSSYTTLMAPALANPTATVQPPPYPLMLPSPPPVTAAYPMMGVVPYPTGSVGATYTPSVGAMPMLPMPAAMGLDPAYFNQQIIAPIVHSVEKAPEAAKAVTAAIGAGIAGAGTLFFSSMSAMNLQSLAILRDAKGAGAQLLATNPTQGWMKHINLPMVAAVSGLGALAGYFHKTLEKDAKAVAEAAKQEETVITTGFNHFTRALAGATGQ